MVGFIVVAAVAFAGGAYVGKKVTVASVEAELKKVETSAVAEVKKLVADIKAKL
jgi:hypothetical protein